MTGDYSTLKALALVGACSTGPALSAPPPISEGAVETGGWQVSQTAAELGVDEAAELTYMREEEKLARDVYRTLFERWRHPIFSNISSAEQRHMDTMARMLEYYDLPDPVVDDATGSLVDPDLSALYAQLLNSGATSLIDALYAGALIEETDIQNLQQAMASTTWPQLIQAYGQLLQGSRNHLRAFARQIENLGEPYAAQILGQDVVVLILAQDMERGPGATRDARRGRGY